MGKLYAIIVFILAVNSIKAQAYRKGSLMVSISEGSTWANFNTESINPETPVKQTRCVDGIRDPLIIEYGLSNRWSLGLTSGADLFKVKPSEFYGFTNETDEVTVKTGELTIDCSYHVFVNKRLDLSVSASAGMFATTFDASTNDATYKYTSNGNMLRFGTKARFYFWRRFGAFGMMSTYFADTSTKDVKGNTVANDYKTSLNGFAIEGGLCYRILR